MIKEILFELKKPRIYITIAIGVVFLYLSGYSHCFGHLGLNDSDIAGNISAQNYLRTTGYNIYNILLESYNYLSGLFPFLIIIPYIYKYNKENANNYSNLLCIRMGYKKYYRRRILIAGLLGGLTLFLTDAVYFGILSTFCYNTAKGLVYFPSGYFAGFYKVNPGFYIIIVFIEHFFLGLGFGLLSTAISMFIKHRPIIYIASYAVFLVSDIVLTGVGLDDFAMTSNYYLSGNHANPAAFAVLFLILVISGVALMLIRRYKRYVYGK